MHRRNVTQPLSLSIRRGEIVILCGSNGIGKTTFGQIVVKHIKGEEINGDFHLPSDVEPVMATQSPSEMLLGLDLNSELPDYKLRKICGLENELDGKLDPRGFSFGTQKLVCIANALRLSSGLAILDEPTSGMDFKQKKRFIELINEFIDHAILIITHDSTIEPLGRVIKMKEPSI